MRAHDALKAIPPRLRSRTGWLIILLFGIGFSISESLYYLRQPHAAPLVQVLMDVVPRKFIGMFFFVVLSPFCWQWTGDDRPKAPPLRGLAQGILLNFAHHYPVRVGLWWIFVRLPFGVPRPPYDFWVGLLGFVTPMVVIGAFLALAEESQKAREEAVREVRRSRWILLRDQISPHVLFNALNGLVELVHQDARRAEQGMLDLSGLYRQLLYHGDYLTVRLGAERELVDRYLRVESLRFGARLQVAWDWDPRLDAVEAPPFLIQPLVENAIKHGLSKHRDGGELRIEGRCEGSEIRLAVSNTGLGLTRSAAPGIGLRNLEGRLHLAFGSEAQMELRTEGEWTVARLRFPMSTLHTEVA